MTTVAELEGAMDNIAATRERLRPDEKEAHKLLDDVELAVRELLEKAKAGLLEELEDEEPDLSHDDEAEWRRRRKEKEDVLR